MTHPDGTAPESDAATQRWHQIEPLLDAALDLPERERHAFLSRACGDDPTLRAEVERLLAGIGEPHPELDAWAGDLDGGLASNASAERIPRAVPQQLANRYRIERELGRGGMATVYLAYDERLEREVAVKVMHADLAHAVGTDRFLREIRLVEQLRHESILPLLDAGEADGVPFFVMPFVNGESLRRRIAREHQLPIEDITRIVTALASALESAHRSGIVHRDVKPENVLLERDAIYLTDFGIARAVSQAAGDRLTDSGLAIGTPGYMSPEQASGGQTIDVRSDVYSLGCLTFEMLTGEPPYTGPSPQVVIAKQLGLPVPSAAVVRDTLPAAMDDVVQRALAKVPADRYQSASAFASAFGAAALAHASVWTRWRRRARQHRGLVSLGIAGVLGVGALAWSGGVPLGPPRATLQPSDSLRYAVLPFARGDADSALAIAAERSAHAALLGWTGITVLEDGFVREAAGAGAASLSRRGAATVARHVRSGRYVRAELRAEGASTLLHAQLYDAVRGDSLLQESTTRIARTGDLDAAMALVMDSLLLRELHGDDAGARGTRSLPARQLFGIGQRAMSEWNLPQADSAFDAASGLDPSYARSQLWLALARMWANADVTRWRIAAEQAVLGEAQLSARERVMAMAAQAQLRGDLARGCSLWRSLTEQDTLQATAWYGSAFCQTADDVVLAERRSPSGWKFRTSYHRALQDYQHAFRLQPAMLAALGSKANEALGRLFKSGPSMLRRGHDISLGQKFASRMEWCDDSLCFVPYLRTGADISIPWHATTVNDAVRHLRATARSIASSWVVAFPQSMMAALTLAQALASLGDPSAIDSLVHARALARTAEERARAAGAEVGMRISFALRDGDTAQLRRARLLADSLLDAQHAPQAHVTLLLTSLASLTGQADRVLRLVRAPQIAQHFSLPDLLRSGEASAYLVLCAMGGPADSLRAIGRRLAEEISHGTTDEERAGLRSEFLARGASVAFPRWQSPLMTTLAADDRLVQVQARAVLRDTAAVRGGLAVSTTLRTAMLPEHISIDVIVPEAELLWRLGDAYAVAQWLDPTLEALPKMQPDFLSSPLRAGLLAPMLLLRARAAAAIGDVAGARRWATAVLILWSHADSFLQPQVQEAQRLVR